jgi:hypothetical protein
MIFGLGVLSGILVTIGVAFILAGDIDNNTDFR